ncbi:RasGAP domain-containing protein ASCRUDRAFT_76657 [Ascoidea rubescens DSM 1968]|uniref:Ras-GAP domain-containing protein n=1 Tax=Ascoidea rubescens DSM 1968 TaxID=1344418 RepID=A0A1D2VEW2_9ASCO|nr:hypothetical protein ASCRUDRAFT_76657 [Ascoidea rubescens DSM 1968]ODV60149.1 hypothetical protein ASCRUDRAFT_76657 [Ascoidea rubescens DSM 1968]
MLAIAQQTPQTSFKSIASGLVNRISSLLSVQTSYSIAETESDPIFISTRKNLLSLATTPVFPDLLDACINLLDSYNKQDKYLPIKKRSDESLKCISIITTLLSDITEKNWSAKENHGLSIVNSQSTSSTSGSDKDIPHTVKADALNTACVAKYLNVLIKLKSNKTVKSELEIIEGVSSQLEYFNSKFIIGDIDYSVTAIIRYIGSSNQLDFSDFVMNSIGNLKPQSHVKDADCLPYFELIGYIYLDETYLLRIFKDAWILFNLVKSPILQQLALAFFVKAIRYWLTARPEEYLSCTRGDQIIVRESENLFDYVYSSFYNGKNSRVAVRLLTTLIILIPKSFENYNNSSKAKLLLTSNTFNKKQKFLSTMVKNLNQITKDPPPIISINDTTTTNATDEIVNVESFTTFFSFAGLLYRYEPNHSLVTFALNYNDCLFDLLHPAYRDTSDCIDNSLYDTLRRDYYTASILLFPEKAIHDVFSVFNDPNSSLTQIYSYMSNIRTFSKNPRAREQFEAFLDQIVISLRNSALRVSDIVKDTVFDFESMVSSSNSDNSNSDFNYSMTYSSGKTISQHSNPSSYGVDGQNMKLNGNLLSSSNSISNFSMTSGGSNHSNKANFILSSSSPASSIPPLRKDASNVTNGNGISNGVNGGSKSRSKKEAARHLFKYDKHDKRSSSSNQPKSPFSPPPSTLSSSATIGTGASSNYSGSYGLSASTTVNTATPSTVDSIVSANTQLDMRKAEASEYRRRRANPTLISREILKEFLGIFRPCPFKFFKTEKSNFSNFTSNSNEQVVAAQESGFLLTEMDDYLQIATIAICDTNTKLVEMGRRFCLRFMNLDDSPSYYQIYSGFFSSGWCIRSLSRSLLNYRLTDKKLKELLAIIVQFIDYRNAIVEQMNVDDLFDNIGSGAHGFCKSLYTELEKIIYICLCSPDVDIYRLVKKTAKVMIDELNSGYRHHKIIREESNELFLSRIGNDDYFVSGAVALQKRIRKFLLQYGNKLSVGLQECLDIMYERWLEHTKIKSPSKIDIIEHRNYSGFIAVTSGLVLDSEADSSSTLKDKGYVKSLINRKMDMLASDDLTMKENAKDVLSSELHPSSQRILLEMIEEKVNKFSYKKGELDESELSLVECYVIIIKGCMASGNKLRNFENSDKFIWISNSACALIDAQQASQQVDTIVLRLMVRACRLFQRLMLYREQLCLRAGMIKVEYLNYAVSWLEESVFRDKYKSRSKDKADENSRSKKEMEYLFSDLSVESSKAIAVLLEGMVLESPSAQHPREFIVARAFSFNNYFTLFLRVLERFSARAGSKDMFSVSKQKAGIIMEQMINSLSNMLGRNHRWGMQFAIPLGFHEDHRVRLSFLKVFNNVIKSLHEETNETQESKEEYYLDATKVLLSSKIFLLVCSDACPSSEVDSYSKSLLSWNESIGNSVICINDFISWEIKKSSSIVDILRRNIVPSRVLSMYAKDHGSAYLIETLRPVLNGLVKNNDFFEVEKIQPGEPGAEQNLNKFMYYLKKLVEDIYNSIDIVPLEFKSICAHMRKEAAKKATETTAIVLVGSFMFLRFLCPAVVSPESENLLDSPPNKQSKRSLILLAKVLQNIANGSLTSLKWPLLLSRMDELNKLNDKIFKFLRLISKDNGYQEKFDISSIKLYLPLDYHKFCYRHMQEIRHNVLDYKNDYGVPLEEKYKLINKLDEFALKIGPPIDLYYCRIPENIKHNDTKNELYDFMNKHADANIDVIVDSPFLQQKIARDGTPMLVFSYFYYQQLDIDQELILFRMFQLASRVWDSKYYVVVDCSRFKKDHSIPLFEEMELLAPEPMKKNCVSMFYYNVCDGYLPILVENIKQREKGGLFNPFNVRYSFLSMFDDPRLIHTLGLSKHSLNILNQVRITFTDFEMYLPEQKKYFPGIIKVGGKYTSFGLAHPRRLKIAGSIKSVRVVNVRRDICFAESSLSHYTDNPYEFSLYDNVDKKQLIFACPRRFELIRTVYISKLSKNNKSLDNLDTIQELQPIELLPEVLCIDFLGILSRSSDIRTSCYDLLASSVECFSLNISKRIRNSEVILFPKDNLAFVTSVSKSLALYHPELTYYFIHYFFTAYKSSDSQKFNCIMFISPWIKNIYDHIFLSNEFGKEKGLEIVKEIVEVAPIDDITIGAFTEYIWKYLTDDDRIAEYLVEEIVNRALNREAEYGDCENVIALLSLYPSIEVCGQVIQQIKEIIYIPLLLVDTEIHIEYCWIKLTVLVKCCVSLFFECTKGTLQFFPDLVHILSMLIDLGPHDLRVSLNSLSINIIHSLLLNQKDFSEAAVSKLEEIDQKISGPSAKTLFGLFRSGKDMNSPLPYDPTRIYGKVLSLESVIDGFVDFIRVAPVEYSTVWNIRWYAYTMDCAFKTNSLILARAIICGGLLCKRDAEDPLVLKFIILALKLFKKYDTSTEDGMVILASCLFAISRLVDGLSPSSIFHTRLFWLGAAITTSANVVLYQGSIKILGRSLDSMERTNGFSDNRVIERIMGDKKIFGDSFVKYESLGNIVVSEKNFDVAMLHRIIRGLRLPYLREAAFHVLQIFFRVRTVHAILASKQGSPYDSNSVSYLLMLYMLSRSNNELKGIMKAAGLDPNNTIFLSESVEVPRILVDYLLTGIPEAMFVLLQGALYFASTTDDYNVKNRFLLLFYYIGKKDHDILFSCYLDIKEQLQKEIVATTTPFHVLQLCYDLIALAAHSPEYPNQERHKNAIDSLLVEYNLLGIRNWAFSSPDPFKESKAEDMYDRLKYVQVFCTDAFMTIKPEQLK